MPKSTQFTVYSFEKLFKSFISDTRKGVRKQPNGQYILSQSIENYVYTLGCLMDYSATLKSPLRIMSFKSLRSREIMNDRKYWINFQSDFTAFLYKRGLSDNTVGSHFKHIKAFFRYLKMFKSIDSSHYIHLFRAIKQEGPVVVLSSDRLEFFINDHDFRNKLSPVQNDVLDKFILGCTTGLRFSDLNELKQTNLEKIGVNTYIKNISQKTNTLTRIKLPVFAIELIKKHQFKYKTLMPKSTVCFFNSQLKDIFKIAGWNEEVEKSRKYKGITKSLRKSDGSSYKFSDMATSHLMRRTAITTMLMLGMPEALVRKISGHAEYSKEFYRYVNYAQVFIDKHTDNVFDQLSSISQ